MVVCLVGKEDVTTLTHAEVVAVIQKQSRPLTIKFKEKFLRRDDSLPFESVMPADIKKPPPGVVTQPYLMALIDQAAMPLQPCQLIDAAAFKELATALKSAADEKQNKEYII